MSRDDAKGFVSRDDAKGFVSRDDVSLLSTSLRSPMARRLVDALDDELRTNYPDHEIEVPLDDHEVSGGSGAFLIAYAGGKPAGCGAVRTLHGTVAEILRMYVAPDARGTGIGAVILEALEEEANRLGITELVLETGDRQVESIRLFESHGYQRSEARNPLMGTHSVFMRKTL